MNKPEEKKSPDKEWLAAGRIIRILNDLDPEQRGRILRFLADRFIPLANGGSP